jgi:uncharacterized protein YbjT (DUF2867 family)
MRIAIIGGTGTLGRHTTQELRSRGHEVLVLSRRAPQPQHRIDLTTGVGLESALKGCQVVVDASNDSSKRAAETLVGGSQRLVAAERAAGVRHHVCVSIVGCDQVPMGYFRVKTEQERAVQEGPSPWSVVRATQFHELVAGTLASIARWRVLPLPRAALQPISCAEVARVVADTAEGTPLRRKIDVAGPETADLRELARTWRAIVRRRALVFPLRLPGNLGRALRAGALVAVHPDVRAQVTFAAWLAADRAAAERTVDRAV